VWARYLGKPLDCRSIADHVCSKHAESAVTGGNHARTTGALGGFSG
jgi:hypothetical protein